MEKLSATLNGALAAQLLLVGYELEIFKEMTQAITTIGLFLSEHSNTSYDS